MPEQIHVHNNYPSEITVPFPVGNRNEELRFQKGWNAVDSGPLDRVTGGFDSDGGAKGGLAAYLFNNEIVIDGRMRPRLELGSPRQSDDVHQCPAVPGVRRHQRTLRAERDRAQGQALQVLLEQATRELAASRQAGDGLVEVDLGNGIKARMTLADAEAYALRQAPAVEAEAAVEEASASFDPGTMTIPELTDAVGAITDADEMRSLLDAEVSGKNRVGAIDVLTEGLAILEA